MENNALQHHGILGMKWGVRRFQRKDGTLTSLGRKRRRDQDDVEDKKEETVEEKRARLLKSTDAKELYENRNLLTTAELNDRINRIDTEARLASKIVEEKKKTGEDYVKSFTSKVDTATGTAITLAKAYNMTANVVNAFNTDGKLLPKIETNVQNGNRDAVKKEKKERQKEAEAKRKREEQEAQRESKHEERAKKKAAKEAEQAKESEKSQNQKKNDSDTTERFEATGDDIFGEGTSKFTGWKSEKASEFVKNAKTRPFEPYEETSTEIVVSGQNFVAGLLEDKSR